MALVLAFLLYDEFESNLFLPLYGLLILASVWVLRRARGSKCHPKYLQYRVLAEALRVQLYLSVSGVERNVGDAFTWTQRQESAWVRAAISALCCGMHAQACVPPQSVKRAWMDDQLAYHLKASKRDGRKRLVNDRTAGWMLFASIALFALVAVMEFFFSQAMVAVLPTAALRRALWMHAGQEMTVRGVIKIMLGGVSAITLFLSSYYGKLSLERKVIDHDKMAALYRLAQRRYEENAAPKQRLLWELAREEIIENGNWYSYCTDNAPSINL